MKKLVFGITGTTGSGKTTVSKEFEKLGVKVIDADKVYHTLIKKGQPCLEEICSFFGKNILNQDGTLDRKALGKIVFTDKKKLSRLNEITHKHIKRAIEDMICTNGLYAIDAAILIGSPVSEICEYIVCVTADKDVRKKRITMRDSLTDEEAMMRIASQPNDDFYIKNSDFVIYNDDRYDIKKETEKILSDMIFRKGD